MTLLGARPERTSPAARDAVTFLTIYTVLRILLPAQYVVGPLGAAGQPAQLLGLGIALGWVADWLGRPWSRSVVTQPLKRLAFFFLIAVLASYLVAAMRPLSSAEQLSSDRSMLNFIAWIGVMLAAMDGITTRARLDTLLRRVTLLGGLEGALGIVQLLAKQSFLQYFALPGLSNTGVDPLLVIRGSFLRPVGTAISPIEYGVFLSMVLPIALHYAVSDTGYRTYIARWFPVGTIACALALSLTRSAILSAAIALVILSVAWPTRLRNRVYLTAAAFMVAASMALHGLLGAVLSLFSGIGTDSSTASRVDSYAVAWSFIARYPIFGRGTGTFLPEYWILDNQYLGSLIELGVVGFACMFLLFLNGVVSSWRLRRPIIVLDGQVVAPASSLGAALAAATAAGCAGFAFFDAYAFPMIPSMLFVLLGCVGALRRLTIADATKGARPASAETAVDGMTVWSLVEAARRRWPLVVAGLIISLVGSYAVAAAPGVYYQQANVLFVAPGGSGLQGGGDGLVSTAGLVASQIGDQGPLSLASTATIVGAGVRDGVWVRLPNNGDQWKTSFSEEDLDVEVVDGSAGQVQALMKATISKIQELLRQDQISVGVRPSQLIETALSPASPPVTYMRSSSSRAGVAVLIIGLILTMSITAIVDRWIVSRPRRWPVRLAISAGADT